MHNVLVIEDEVIVSEALKEILSRLGYHADIAPEGYEGIRMFEGGLFDLVITDVKMAGIDGYEVARHIRNSQRPLTPIVGISGTPRLLQGDEFDWFIPKPFGLQAISDALNNLLTPAVPSKKDSCDTS